MYLTPNIEFDIQYGIAVGKVEGTDNEKNENNDTIKAGVMINGTPLRLQTPLLRLSAFHTNQATDRPKVQRSSAAGKQWLGRTPCTRRNANSNIYVLCWKGDPVVYEPPNGPLRASTLYNLASSLSSTPTRSLPIHFHQISHFACMQQATGTMFDIADGDHLTSMLSSSRASSTR